VKVVLNAAPAQPLPADLLALIDILIVNEGELAAISNHTGNVEQNLARVHVPCVIVTLGSEGALAQVDGKLIRQAAFPVKPVDTTAAGDTFCGVLVATLSQGQTVAQAMRRACAAGALACLKPGAQSSIPTQSELDSFLQTSTIQ
jgi:ribokinase